MSGTVLKEVDGVHVASHGGALRSRYQRLQTLMSITC
jgi:hypothetical protein